MRGIICEIGLHHFGVLERAKTLITAAKDAGADYVKMQLIDPVEFQGGSMPRKFYLDADLGAAGYLECIDHAEKVGVPIFFSIFGPKYIDLIEYYPKMPYKISGEQLRTMCPEALNTLCSHWRGREIVVSAPTESALEGKEDALRQPNVSVLYVTPYLSLGDLDQINRYRQILARPVGLSCHVPGVENCKKAILEKGVTLIEKHFNIWGSQTYGAHVYRDSIHAMNQDGLVELVECFRKKRIHDERVFI